MARKKYFRAEVALISLTVAVLILFTSIITYRLIQEHGETTVGVENNDSNDNGNNATDSEDETGDDVNIDKPNTGSDPQPTNRFIDLQPIVNSWVATTNRQVGLVIYDLDHDRVAADYQPNLIFDIASVYKLFYVYDGYRQIASGVENLNDYFTIKASPFLTSTGLIWYTLDAGRCTRERTAKDVAEGAKLSGKRTVCGQPSGKCSDHR